MMIIIMNTDLRVLPICYFDRGSCRLLFLLNMVDCKCKLFVFATVNCLQPFYPSLFNFYTINYMNDFFFLNINLSRSRVFPEIIQTTRSISYVQQVDGRDTSHYAS